MESGDNPRYLTMLLWKRNKLTLISIYNTSLLTYTVITIEGNPQYNSLYWRYKGIK